MAKATRTTEPPNHQTTTTTTTTSTTTTTTLHPTEPPNLANIFLGSLVCERTCPDAATPELLEPPEASGGASAASGTSAAGFETPELQDGRGGRRVGCGRALAAIGTLAAGFETPERQDCGSGRHFGCGRSRATRAAVSTSSSNSAATPGKFSDSAMLTTTWASCLFGYCRMPQ